jgi:RNA polymerase sigma-70 factor (ECF subfamily)
LYKIATNVCFDLLKKRRRRSLPTQEYPAANPQMLPGPPLSETVWLEPFPDARLPLIMENDPEQRIITQESVTLAFIATLQLLSAHQRAVLILRDVLGFRASEAAEILDLTVSAVNSLLHRARVNLSKDYDPNKSLRLPYEDESTQKLLDQYRHAWETADVTALVTLIKEDASFSMPPLSAWYQSREAILQFLDLVIFRHAAPGEIQLRPVRANEQPAFATYERNHDSDTFAASGIQLITIDIHTLQIANIISFRNAELVSRFDLPATI